MRAVCRDISIKHQKRVFEVEHASDEPCESVAGKEISAGINKWKQPTLFEQRDKWNICILGDLDAGREVLSLLWLRLKIFSQNLYQRTRKARSVFFFLYMFSRKTVICIQTHHVVALHSVISWSVIGLERWKSLCGTVTLGEFTYQFVSWLSKSNQSCRSPNVCGACSYFLNIKYKHKQ